MNPTQLLVILLVITGGALVLQLRGRSRRAAALRNLATRNHLHYSPRDRFGLAPRVAQNFPVPGVADVRVYDLLYRSDDAGHRYIFTADYTQGVLGAKRRHHRVVLMTEPRATSAGPPPAGTLRFADGTDPLIAQYESLLK